MTKKNEAPESDSQPKLSWYQSLAQSYAVHSKLSCAQSLDVMAPRLRILTIVLLTLLVELAAMIWFRIVWILIKRYVH